MIRGSAHLHWRSRAPFTQLTTNQTKPNQNPVIPFDSLPLPPAAGGQLN